MTLIRNAVFAAVFCSAGSVSGQSGSFNQALFMQAWGTSNPQFDVNADGIVNALDLSILLNNSADGSGGSQSSPSGGSEPTSPLAQLTAGSGFTGLTPEPTQVGAPTALYADFPPAARWDDVNFQSINGNHIVGVIAYHQNGIERVEFSLNGGPWTAVSNATERAGFGVKTFQAAFNSEVLPAGSIGELRARVWPKAAGMPLVLQNPSASIGVPNGVSAMTGLHSMFVHAGTGTPAAEMFVALSGADTNAGTAAAPVRTIGRALDLLRAANKISNAFVTLKEAGSYGAPRTTGGPVNNPAWTTIRRSPSLPDGVCQIVSTAADGSLTGRNLIRTQWKRLRWQGVQFENSQISQLYLDPTQYIWLDGCRHFDVNGPTATYGGTVMYPIRPASIAWNPTTLAWVNTAIGGSYVTNCLAGNQVYGYPGVSYIRGSHVTTISCDAFANARCVLGCSLDQLSGTAVPGLHADVLQYTHQTQNVIVSRFRGWGVDRAQNFFFDPHLGSEFKNCAFVDVAIENIQPDMGNPKSQMSNKSTNVMFINVSNPGQYWVFRDDFAAPKTFAAVGVTFRNCALEWLTRTAGPVPARPSLPAGVVVDHCHFSNPLGLPTGPAALALSSGAISINVAAENWSMGGPGSLSPVQSGSAIYGFDGGLGRGPLVGAVPVPAIPNYVSAAGN